MLYARYPPLRFTTQLIKKSIFSKESLIQKEDAMKYYAGIDLHSNNNYLVILDEEQRVCYDKRLVNELSVVEQALRPYAEGLVGVVVESTYNWYWLADGLLEKDYQVHLAHTATLDNYARLKHSDDKSDARWLANLLRLNVLPTGYIYPAKERGLREVLRKRTLLVRQRTMNILSLEGTLSRYEGIRLNGRELQALSLEAYQGYFQNEEVQQAVRPQWKILMSLNQEIDQLEKYLKNRIKISPTYNLLKTVPGVGEILAATIELETGAIERFAQVGNYASYCRCVKSDRLSNGKKKGENNRKNGNGYLSWAYVEAAHHAIRYYDPIRRYYDRKKSKANTVLAIKAVAHKLARSSYFILKNKEVFDMKKAFKV
jgi:transposase